MCLAEMWGGKETGWETVGRTRPMESELISMASAWQAYYYELILGILFKYRTEMILVITVKNHYKS